MQVVKNALLKTLLLSYGSKRPPNFHTKHFKPLKDT